MLSRIRDAPFLPKLASPSVQSSYDISRSQTSYHEQYQEHHLDQRPRNYSLEHHAKHRREFALTHADNPKEHYTTTTMSVTSPDRCADLAKASRPLAYPHEINEPIKTSAFQFRTTNEDLFRASQPPSSDDVLARQREKDALRSKKASSKAGSLRFDALDGVRQGASDRRDAKRHSATDDTWLLTTNQATERRAAAVMEASKRETKGSSEGGSTAFRPLPFSFPDEIQMDHSHLGLGSDVCSSYHSNATSVKDFWSRGAADRKNVLSPPRALHCALPSISLAYAATPAAAKCDNCRRVVARGTSRAGGPNGRTSIMQSTYQQDMADPLRARSSLF